MQENSARGKGRWWEGGKSGTAQRIVFITVHSVFQDTQSKERKNWYNKREKEKEKEKEREKMKGESSKSPPIVACTAPNFHATSQFWRSP